VRLVNLKSATYPAIIEWARGNEAKCLKHGVSIAALKSAFYRTTKREGVYNPVTQVLKLSKHTLLPPHVGLTIKLLTQATVVDITPRH